MEQLSNEELSAKLIGILETGPLYSKLKYIGATLFVLPQELRLDCPSCGPSRRGSLSVYNRLNIPMTGQGWRPNAIAVETATKFISVFFPDGSKLTKRLAFSKKLGNILL
jgi:hypothetical protein